jgi:hypothetical protein
MFECCIDIPVHECFGVARDTILGILDRCCATSITKDYDRGFGSAIFISFTFSIVFSTSKDIAHPSLFGDEHIFAKMFGIWP